MSRPAKKREIEQEIEDVEDESSEESEEEEEDDDDQVEDMDQEIIQVDFDGRNPQDPDYHGIKTLLQQLFLKAHVDLGGLADLIISQNYVGSVITQSEDDYSDDEDSTNQEVFGITTVVNISERLNEPCIKDLRDLLKQHAEEHATDSTYAMIKNVLENDSAPLGLLINERFINIPTQISVPLLENLVSEVRRATHKSMPFNFAYYIVICKLKKPNPDNKRKSKNKNFDESEVIWSNAEEEIFVEEAVCDFEFTVDSETGVTGGYTKNDVEWIPCRRVLLLEASKLPVVINKIKSKLAS